MKKYNLYLALIFIVFFSCTSPSKQGGGDENGPSVVLPDALNEVKVMPLLYADFDHELLANGSVLANQKANLHFQSTEIITSIYVKNGDRVAKGQKIAELETFKLSIALAQAQDNMEKATLELQDVLIGQGFSLSDTAKTPIDVMKIAKVKSNFDQSKINKQLAEYNLKNAVLYAPFEGVVANMFTKVHNIPNTAEAFCTIIDKQSPEVVFMVLESELLFVHMGDKVKISPFSMSDLTYEGSVSEINPMIDKNGMVRIKAKLNAGQQQQLYDGMNVKVIVQKLFARLLLIPKEALVLRSNKKVVFTLSQGRAKWVYVQTGMENSTSYVVTEGLNEGDSIIYEGNINLAHEAPVKYDKSGL